MSSSSHSKLANTLSISGVLITLGIVFGDIGTSPLYVLKAIIGGVPVSKEYIYGALSCIIWTLTLQTTVKYVIITLRADNNGEGGIFSLFAIFRRKFKWGYILAIIGGSTLFADGIITPAITVVSAIEGLKILNPAIMVIPIAILILVFLFSIQQYGTSFLGKSFGPLMVIWFGMLAFFGIYGIMMNPDVIRSFNPYYAYKLLTTEPSALIILGAVFLCTTGAEALYSDLGHCGIKNIRISWIFVKASLILNYLGQGAWILTTSPDVYTKVNPFFAMMPAWFVLSGVIIATIAAIIASQALITGSYTLISEAIFLDFWPKVKINFPSTEKGQMYVPSINWFLMFACIAVVLIFQESSNMEAAYGLSISITMLMTTTLLALYLIFKRVNHALIYTLVSIYFIIEISFLMANLTKFTHGGWITLLLASFFFIVMYVWYNGRKIKSHFVKNEDFRPYVDMISDISNDNSIPKYASNLVFLTHTNKKHEIETKIIRSIIYKFPKRADVYWLIHVDTVDDPHHSSYRIEPILEGKIYRINFLLGFKVAPRINLLFRYVLENMTKNKEIDLTSRFQSLNKYNITGDFRFVLVDRIQNYDFNFSAYNQLIMNIYSIIKEFGITETKAYGLDASTVTFEEVSLQKSETGSIVLERLYD